MAMRDVSIEEAKQSKYYGFGGWMIIFYILAALALIVGVVGVIPQNALPGLDPDVVAIVTLNAFPGVDPNVVAIVTLVQCALVLPFLILTPLKHRLMPAATIVCAWLSLVITIGLYFIHWSSISAALDAEAARVDAGAEVASIGMILTFVSVVVMVVVTALLTWYLISSKRVNATYRHRVRADAAVAPTAAAQIN